MRVSYVEGVEGPKQVQAGADNDLDSRGGKEIGT